MNRQPGMHASLIVGAPHPMIIAVGIKSAVVTLRKSRTAPHIPQDSYSSAGLPAL